MLQTNTHQDRGLMYLKGRKAKGCQEITRSQEQGRKDSCIVFRDSMALLIPDFRLLTSRIVGQSVSVYFLLLQRCVGFCHTARIGHNYTHIPSLHPSRSSRSARWVPVLPATSHQLTHHRAGIREKNKVEDGRAATTCTNFLVCELPQLSTIN